MSGGLITTRAASESNLGEDVAVQLLARPRPLAVGAGGAGRPGAHSRPAQVVVPRRRGAARRRRPTRTAQTADGRRPSRGGGGAAARRPMRSDGVDRGRSARRRGRLRAGVAGRREAGRHAAEPRARRSAGRSPPRPASSCRRCTSPTTCSSGRAPTRSWSRASKWRAASCYADRLLAINPGTAVGARSTASQTREPAFGLPATWIADRAARPAPRPPATRWSIRPPRCRRTCRRPSAPSCRIC